MAKIFVIPNERFESASIKESSGISYLFPTNRVLTGRYHKGDENGTTWNYQGLVKV